MDDNKNQALITFKAQSKYNNYALVICIFVTIIGLIIGIKFSESTVSNFLCSCAVGLSCGYITGWVASYFANKQTACLLELDYKIHILDDFIKKCDFQTNAFTYKSDQFPQKLDVFNLGDNPKNYFQCLCRMGAVFNEIAKCENIDLSEILVSFHSDNNTSESIKIGEFHNRLNSFCSEQVQKHGGINISPQQCNGMLLNSMVVKNELNKAKRSLIQEKEAIIFKRKAPK